MISIFRKNLSSSALNPKYAFPCNSNLRFFLSIQINPFSTSRIKRLLIPNPKICDVLVDKHQFSPELASLASSRLPNFKSPERADSVLSFLKEYSFTTTQLEKIVVDNPRILGFTVEGLKSRFKVFQDLGLSPFDIAKIMSMNQTILQLNVENRILPKLSILKSLLGSDEEVAGLLRKTAWFITNDLEKTLLPNVEILKSCGIPMELILSVLLIQTRCFLIKPSIMRKSVDRAIAMGVSQTSTVFIQAANVLSFTSEEMWEVKLQILRDFGFSDDDSFAMFRKQPTIFAASAKKMKHAIEVVLATGKYDISNIVTSPVSLGCSIEKRLEPRMQILEILESRSLIQKWPALSRVATLTDDNFFDRFIRPYYAEIGEEHIPKIFIDRGGKKGDLMLKELV